MKIVKNKNIYILTAIKKNYKLAIYSWKCGKKECELLFLTGKRGIKECEFGPLIPKKLRDLFYLYPMQLLLEFSHHKLPILF